MSCQLVDDCLIEIFEYLKKDKITLHSCLLVNHHWCNVSVRILWRDIWSYKVIDQRRVSSLILSTLFACLSNKSKEFLHKNRIFISPPTSKSPLFNYSEFCKVLSINKIYKIVENNFKPINDNLKHELSNYDNKSLEYNSKQIIINEIVKMISNQNSLKKIIYKHDIYQPGVNFNCFSGLKDLSELNCNTNLPSDFFYKLSQICHNLQSISIKFCDYHVPNELKELIIIQNNLKNITLIAFNNSIWQNILPTLTKHSNTITKLHLFNDVRNDNYNLSPVKSFSNLQEIMFSYFDSKDFVKLQNAIFPKLKVLKFHSQYGCPGSEYMIKFLENNGKNLKKFYSYQPDDAMNLSIANFCPNLKSFYVIPKRIDVLKTILENCQYLESFQTKCTRYLTKKEILETIVNYSPNNFCELKISNFVRFDLLNSKDLESCFISWKSRKSKKLLSLTITEGKNHYNSDFVYNDKNIEIIKKYESLGVIKFEIKDYKDIEKYYN